MSKNMIWLSTLYQSVGLFFFFLGKQTAIHGEMESEIFFDGTLLFHLCRIWRWNLGLSTHGMVCLWATSRSRLGWGRIMQDCWWKFMLLSLMTLQHHPESRGNPLVDCGTMRVSVTLLLQIYLIYADTDAPLYLICLVFLKGLWWLFFF